MKYWIITSLVVFITLYAILAWIAFLLYWPVQTLVINNYDENHPIPVETKVLKPGDRLVYTLDYCKYTDKRAIVRRTLVDGQIIILQDTVGALPRGCRQFKVDTAVVPETINAGRYYLDVEVEYEVNRFRTQTAHYRTEYFEVVEPEKKATAVIFGQPAPVYIPEQRPTSSTEAGPSKPQQTIINNNIAPRIEAENEGSRIQQDEPTTDQEPPRGVIDGVRDVLGL